MTITKQILCIYRSKCTLETANEQNEAVIASKSISTNLKTFLCTFVDNSCKNNSMLNIQDNVNTADTSNIDIDEYIDTTFVGSITECMLNNIAWENEKIELMLAVKECAARYNGVKVFDPDAVSFQDYYEHVLYKTLKCNFNKVITSLPPENENIHISIVALQRYLSICFNAFGQDSMYMRIRDYSNNLERYKVQLDALSTQQNEILIKHAELGKRQTNYEDQQIAIKKQQTELATAIETAVSDANESIAQQAQKVAESSITILGIFVGIVMVFFGDFSILSSAAAGLFDAPIYRLAIVLISFSAVLFNIIILLFYLISKLTQKSMGNACPYMTAQGCKDCSNCAHKPQLYELCRLRSTLPYVYWGNAVIVLLLIFTFCMYLFSGLRVELVPVTLRPFGILIQLSDTRSIQDMTFLQVLLSSVITVVAFVCLCKLGRPTQTKA